jgi:hypothetical protein
VLLSFSCFFVFSNNGFEFRPAASGYPADLTRA